MIISNPISLLPWKIHKKFESKLGRLWNFLFGIIPPSFLESFYVTFPLLLLMFQSHTYLSNLSNLGATLYISILHLSISYPLTPIIYYTTFFIFGVIERTQLNTQSYDTFNIIIFYTLIFSKRTTKYTNQIPPSITLTILL